jgi:excinuclease ABC subunit C
VELSFRIEAYDVAHISGTNTVGMMVVGECVDNSFEIVKNEQRKFIIRSSKNDDLASLSELLTRRFGHPEWRYPNLIVIDGGETHLSHTRGVLFAAGVHIPVVSVVKDASHKARGLLGEELYTTKYSRECVELNAEVHRAAVAFHRSRRDRFRR